MSTKSKSVTISEKPAHQKKPRPIDRNGVIAQWLNEPGMQQYLGATTIFKLDVLLTLRTGGVISHAAKRNWSCRQAAYRHAKNARAIFGM